MNIVKQFIEDNNLDFTDSGSSLNSNCVILAGYACVLGLEWSELIDFLEDIPIEDIGELERVFNYARSHNYGAFWETEEAHKLYKF